MKIDIKECQVINNRANYCPTPSFKSRCFGLFYLGTGLFRTKTFLKFTHQELLFFFPAVNCIWAKAQEFGSLFTFVKWQNSTDLILSNLSSLQIKICLLKTPKFCKLLQKRILICLADIQRVKTGLLLENRSRTQRLGSPISHHYASTKWQIQRQHRCLKVVFVTQTQSGNAGNNRSVPTHPGRIPAYRGCLQFQNFLGWLKRCVCTWAAAVPFGRAERVLENTHRPGAGNSPEPHERPELEVIES